MIQLQSFGILACVLGLCVCAAFYFRARELDRWDEYHLMHGPDSGCTECADK